MVEYMPKVTIWIRKEDEAKWQAIADKPEWLHEHLRIGTAGVNSAVALEDIKAGQFGSVYVQGPMTGDPTIEPLKMPHSTIQA